MLLGSAISRAQVADATASANQKRAHQIVSSTIQALGGQAWLDLRTLRDHGRTAAYFQGTATGVLAETTETSELPDKERVDFAGKGRVVQIYTGQQAWEITYKGAKEIPKPQMDEYRRWQAHSLGTALRQWFRDPSTVLMDDGQTLVERRSAYKVTLMDRHNDAITLEVDAATHLPVRLTFEWRDPRFHDKNLDAVEYDNYQLVSGIATPFTITRTHNGQTISQRFISRVKYDVEIAPGFFNPMLEAKRKR